MEILLTITLSKEKSRIRKLLTIKYEINIAILSSQKWFSHSVDTLNTL